MPKRSMICVPIDSFLSRLFHDQEAERLKLGKIVRVGGYTTRMLDRRHSHLNRNIRSQSGGAGGFFPYAIVAFDGIQDMLSLLGGPMTRPLTIFAAVVMGISSRAQVLTISPNDHARWTSKLTENDRILLLPALQDATGEHNADVLKLFSAFKVPLSKADAPVIVATSIKDCGMHGNCEFLVFRKQAAVYVPILDSIAGDWDLKDTRHHGYRDIDLTDYQGAHWIISTWEYGGRRYHVSACIERATDGTQDQKPLEQCGS